MGCAEGGRCIRSKKPACPFKVVGRKKGEMFKKYSNEFIVGLFVIVCGILLFWVFSQLRGGGRGSEIPIYAVFETANGLIPDNAVTMAGVRIGRVGEIALEEGKARVKLMLQQGTTIREEDTASVQARSLLGEKVLVIVPGPRTSRIVTAGATLKKTLPTVDITDLFGAIKPIRTLLEDLAPELKPLASEITTLMKNLNKAVETDPQGAKSLLVNFNGLMQEARETLKTARLTLQENRSSLRGAMASARRLLGDRRLSEIIGSVREGSQRLPALVERLDTLTRRLDALAAAVPPSSMKKIQPLLSDAAEAMLSARRLLGDLGGQSQRLSNLLRNLDVIFRKLVYLDEWHIRKFLQQEGVFVRMFGPDGKIVRHIEHLQKQPAPR